MNLSPTYIELVFDLLIWDAAKNINRIICELKDQNRNERSPCNQIQIDVNSGLTE